MHFSSLTQKTEKADFTLTLTNDYKLHGIIINETLLFTFTALRVSDLTRSSIFWSVLIVGQGA